MRATAAQLVSLASRLLAAAVLAACGAAAPGDSYFPLGAGHTWQYRVVTEWENQNTERETLELSTHGEDNMSGAPAWRRRSASGVDYWLRSDATGIYRVATKTDLQAEPEADKLPRYVLKMPLAVGTTWQATTPSYLMRRRSDFPPEIRHSHPAVAMTYTIESLGETVKTPAGAFNDCLKVKGMATIRVFADPAQGWRDLPLTTLEWYCKGVGLVKLERQEPANSPFLIGGSLTMELMQWQ